MLEIDALPALRDTLPLVVTLAAVSALAVMVWQTQLAMGSRAAGRTIYSAADVLGDLSRDGDSVLYLPANRRVVIAVYADAFAGLDQIRLHTPGRNALLVDDLPTADFLTALGTATRMWVVWSPPPDSRSSNQVPTANRRRAALILGLRRPPAGVRAYQTDP